MTGPTGLSRRHALLLPALALLPAQATAAPASVDTIRDLLTRQIEIGRFSLGYVAAVSGSGVISVGQASAAGGRALDGDTVFEIGSITKVFTALLLAEMVQRGEVAFSDPAAKYLPPEAQPQSFDGKPFTLLDLATHTSGLPRMPGNIVSEDPGNPYADYTAQQLYEALRAHTLAAYPGSHYSYSNFGMGLLGHVLSLRAGRSYEELVLSRICEPLGLGNTRITLTPGMRERLTPGHDAQLRPVQNWDLPVMAGAGALRSTANDLLRFLRASQGQVTTALAPALAALLEVRRQSDTRREVVAAGWFVRNQHDDEVVWKDGDTGGYSAFAGYSTRSGVAAVLLANSASGSTTPQTGQNLINPAFALPILRQVVAVDPRALFALAGVYALSKDFLLVVRAGEGRLTVQATNEAEYEVFPESSTRFFYREIDAQLTFELGADGTASAVVLHQNGRDLRAARSPWPPKQNSEATP